MEFKQKQTIYLQIAENICEKILRGSLKEKEKIPSIRNLAVDLQVNPNTVQRTYEHLQKEDIIYTQRGLGYFVAEGAKKKIAQNRRERFLEKELPAIFTTMELLDIDIEAISKAYKSFKK